MKAIINRLRKLERVKVPTEQSTSAAEILRARERRLGIEPIQYPQDWFAGCRTIADTMLRARKFPTEHQP